MIRVNIDDSLLKPLRKALGGEDVEKVLSDLITELAIRSREVESIVRMYRRSGLSIEKALARVSEDLLGYGALVVGLCGAVVSELGFSTPDLRLTYITYSEGMLKLTFASSAERLASGGLDYVTLTLRGEGALTLELTGVLCIRDEVGEGVVEAVKKDVMKLLTESAGIQNALRLLREEALRCFTGSHDVRAEVIEGYALELIVRVSGCGWRKLPKVGEALAILGPAKALAEKIISTGSVRQV